MTKTILFRADGNATKGLGHLYRLFSLVEMLKDYYDTVFLTKEESTFEVIPKGYKVSKIPKDITIDKEPEWINLHFSSKLHIIIADGYHFDSSYQQALKQYEFNLIYIDDLADKHMYADIVVNHSPNCFAEDYKGETYTRYALGTNYAMLRPKFNEAAKAFREIKDIRNAFICFGGSDQFDLSFKAAKALLNINSIKQINIVIGAAYKHLDIIKLAENHQAIKIYQNLNEADLCQVMQLCQIAVAPASTILYEICSIKMPVLSGYYVHNQKNIYKGLSEKGAIAKGGDFTSYEVSDFQKQIEKILNNDIKAQIDNQQELFKGNSARYFLGLINSLSISFRKANIEDLMLVYNWSNDKVVRQNSYQTEPIKLEEHKSWFLNKIEDEKSLILIAMVNNQPSGVVRYEINDENSVVGIVVSKAYRGQGLAPSFLKEAATYYFKRFDKPIYAYIKKENLASIKSFEKARYKYFKDKIIKGNLSFVYKLKKSDAER